MRQVQYGVTQEHHQLFVLSREFAGQRLIPGFHYDAFSGPLPKLRLRGPELLPVAADDDGSLSLSLFLLIAVFPGIHILVNTPVPLHGTSFRRGEETPPARSHT